MIIIIKDGKEMSSCFTLYPPIQTLPPRPQENYFQGEKKHPYHPPLRWML